MNPEIQNLNIQPDMIFKSIIVFKIYQKEIGSVLTEW